jgi:archaetidylinositol phosphate synthase
VRTVRRCLEGEEIISHDTWIHKGVRAAVRPLIRTRITPNHITTVRLLTGLAAAAMFAIGGPLWPHIGGALFVISVVLDRADGELARLGGKSTPWGHTYDLIADAVCNAAVLAGVGIGLRDGPFGGWALPMGLLAGGSVAFILWSVIRVEEAEGARAAELPAIGGFDVDDAVLFIPITIWLGGGAPLLVGAAVCAPTVAVFFLWRLIRALSSKGEKPE